ncbi:MULTISPECIES: hypothetical protein [Bacillus]|uniref:hypothetical protein n=1 Tax=Bacillus TaxID=1386 RepID=UPI0008FE6829|nr:MULTISPECIES: hypothetical protein [Bacillus]MDA1564016.1 hypothetical protein [Bacillus cereus group sp. TH243-1LC]OJD66218.1 hypothetical protein BAU26_10055 [Bacillus sp. N35-10-4]PFC97136.1 hypothetical protein CN308_07870 [Bacillus cereus]
MCNRCIEGINEIVKHKDNTHELIIEHIKKIDEGLNNLKGADAFCSLMQAKSTALLALSHTPPYQK